VRCECADLFDQTPDYWQLATYRVSYRRYRVGAHDLSDRPFMFRFNSNAQPHWMSGLHLPLKRTSHPIYRHDFAALYFAEIHGAEILTTDVRG